eukprot:Seg249.8 transcript_id=Seg249.8/GoldUCD/mRNA.D3Y31 product="hypothetical protein" protein_id=Seg249.8/GoldUCD/D3Y31
MEQEGIEVKRLGFMKAAELGQVNQGFMTSIDEGEHAANRNDGGRAVIGISPENIMNSCRFIKNDHIEENPANNILGFSGQDRCDVEECGFVDEGLKRPDAVNSIQLERTHEYHTEQFNNLTDTLEDLESTQNDQIISNDGAVGERASNGWGSTRHDVLKAAEIEGMSERPNLQGSMLNEISSVPSRVGELRRDSVEVPLDSLSMLQSQRVGAEERESPQGVSVAQHTAINLDLDNRLIENGSHAREGRKEESPQDGDVLREELFDKSSDNVLDTTDLNVSVRSDCTEFFYTPEVSPPASPTQGDQRTVKFDEKSIEVGQDILEAGSESFDPSANLEEQVIGYADQEYLRNMVDPSNKFFVCIYLYFIGYTLLTDRQANKHTLLTDHLRYITKICPIFSVSP